MEEVSQAVADVSGTVWGVIAAVFIAALIVYSIVTSIQLSIACSRAYKRPTMQNAWRVYKLLCRFGVAIENHPKTWGKYRDMFYEVNQSSEVSTELKEKLKARLIKKGLYIKNMRIIDNYTGGRK